MNDLSGIPGGSSSLIDRAKGILLKPAEEWAKIASETTSIADVAKGYALPLILIGPTAAFIGLQVFGLNLVFTTYRPSLGTGVTIAITSLVAAIIGVAVLTLVAEFLAPNFGGEANRTKAFKLVVYSMTAGWVASILAIIPALAAIGGLLGLYGFYLFYVGATPMMKVPKDKAVVYTVVAVVCAIVINIVVNAVTGTLMRPPTPSPFG
jgi:hypothetical protein